MLVIVPVVLISIFVIFGAGYVPLYAALSAIAKRSPYFLSNQDRGSQEKNIEIIAILGGVVSIAAWVVVMINLPNTWRVVFWLVFIALGYLGGIFINLGLNGKNEKVKVNYKANYDNMYQRSASPHTPPPPPPAPEPKPARVVSQAAPIREDPYQELLAKAMYNQATVDLLLDDERRRTPNARFDELCRSAIERLGHIKS